MSDEKSPRRYAGKKPLTTYLEPVISDRFKALANRRNQSQAALLELIIKFALARNAEEQGQDDTGQETFAEGKRLTSVYNVRLTEGEGKRLDAEAKRHDMRPSPFIRFVLRGAITKQISLSEVEHDSLQKMRAELSKIGSNLNQAVKLMKANPYGENLVTLELLKTLQKGLEEEKQLLKTVLESNLKTWANIYE